MITFAPINESKPLEIVASNLAEAHSFPVSYACIGDEVHSGDNEILVRGHGTQLVEDRLVASIVGIIHRQNKLITVDPLKRRYVAAVGDVIVGRITEISGKRWRVDVNGQGETVLLLSAVHLPGGEQRRRTAQDELSMREVFAEGDLVSAEVQKVQHDGIVMLHTRSIKYGLLKGGLLVTVPASLIKRQKQHFQHIETLGIDIIMGRNGMIWVAPHRKSREEGGLMEVDSSCDIHRELRECIARVAQAIRVLARLNFMVSSESIVSTYSLSLREKCRQKR